ncbi:hypothetical protein [Natrinema sp. 1APR25-10V2]|uniref:hypothetical protein n=1 Tax=Natrinema sp. 1APR25-10V2 TaxID=2951081 RepID=UPI002875DCAB|nr:hypothetical protein [Natrinema sp. 1APR25-10V2]MDS0477749.1 hypothetical protein [Natrinema sp. 1APR25-10V2]
MTDRDDGEETVTDRTGENRDETGDSGIELTHSDTDGAAADSTNDESEPLGDLAATVAERSDADSSDPAFDDLFDRQDVADVETDELWVRLESDDANGPSEAIRSADRTVREVEKRAYCQDCEHFADPPETACTREGTDILAVPTVTTFRVADCPVVRDAEALEDPY